MICAHFTYLDCLLYTRATLHARVLCGPTFKRYAVRNGGEGAYPYLFYVLKHTVVVVVVVVVVMYVKIIMQWSENKTIKINEWVVDYNRSLE